MNRPILFRGKRTDNDQWVEGFAWIGKNINEVEQAFIIVPGQAAWIQVDVKSVGQCIFLPCDNEKKLFIGDILKYNAMKGEIRGVIVETNTGWGFHIPGEHEGSATAYLNYFTFTKVGNIHDNPELLKNTK